MQNQKLVLSLIGVIALSVLVLNPQQQRINQPDESSAISSAEPVESTFRLHVAENTECNPRVRVCEQE